jgi:competence protein ComFC
LLRAGDFLYDNYIFRYPPSALVDGVFGREVLLCSILMVALVVDSSLKPYLDALAELFFPRYCVGCSRRASDLLCRRCFEALPRIEGPRCERCGMPAVFETPVCEECKFIDFGFESARSSLRYEGVGEKVVHALKYRGHFEVVGRLMAPLLVESLRGELGYEHVVPVPLHPSRFRRRGFNQAELMARGVAERLGTRVSDKIQVVRRTRDQVLLSAAERRANVRGAFVAREPVRGRVLLVDDVFTTGATLSECAVALKTAGAGEVRALTLCRTV